jgi:hypothetical protein
VRIGLSLSDADHRDEKDTPKHFVKIRGTAAPCLRDQKCSRAATESSRRVQGEVVDRPFTNSNRKCGLRVQVWMRACRRCR